MKPYSGSIRHDYKDSPNEASETPKRHWSWFLFGLSLPLLVVTLFLVTESDESEVVPVLDIAKTTESPVPLSLPQTTSATIDSDLENGDPPDESIQLSVGPGESLELLFRRHDLSLADLSVISRLSGAATHLRILLPGDEINITHQEGRVTSLMREIDEASVLSIVREPAGFKVEIIETKRVARKDNKIYDEEEEIGIVTSGSFSPTLGKPIGYCFVPVEYSLEREIKIDIGGKFYDSKLTSTRFYKR